VACPQPTRIALSPPKQKGEVGQSLFAWIFEKLKNTTQKPEQQKRGRGGEATFVLMSPDVFFRAFEFPYDETPENTITKTNKNNPKIGCGNCTSFYFTTPLAKNKEVHAGQRYSEQCRIWLPEATPHVNVLPGYCAMRTPNPRQETQWRTQFCPSTGITRTSTYRIWRGRPRLHCVAGDMGLQADSALTREQEARPGVNQAAARCFVQLGRLGCVESGRAPVRMRLNHF
jgi:hypothetical protein